MEPPKENHFPTGIFLIIFTPYIYTLITTIFQGKKYKIFVPFQNGGQIINLHFASFRFRPKFEKNTFPKELFNEIWLKLGDHEYINIPEIEFAYFSFRGDFRGESIFSRFQNANLC